MSDGTLQDVTAFLAAEAGPLAIRFSNKSESVRLYSATGSVHTAVGLEASMALFAALGSRKVWSEDAAQLDRDNDLFLEALGRPRIYCARTVDQVLAPEKKKSTPPKGAALARLMRAHNEAPRAHRAIAMQIEDEDRMWREVSRRGYLVDQHALSDEIQRHTRVIENFARSSGFDVRAPAPGTRNWEEENLRRDDAKAAWLDRHGVGFDRSADAKWAEPSRCDLSRMPASQQVDWDAYDMAYQSLHRLAPLLSLRRAVQSDGRCRPLIRVNAAVTGRMSILSPALQNLPHKRQGTRHVIQMEPGFDCVSVDHSNAELRVLARFMVGFLGTDAFTRRVMDGDLYQDIADATGQPRSEAKWQVIAYLYAMKQTTLAKEVGAPMAAAVHRALKELVPEIPAFCEEMTARSRTGDNRFETLMGRPLPKLDGASFETRHELQVNLLVQGSARDAWGVGVRRAAAALGEDRMLIPLHDELFVASPRGRSKETAAALLQAMTVDLGEGIVLHGKPTVTFGRWAPAPIR
jgi:hypothetical protein